MAEVKGISTEAKILIGLGIAILSLIVMAICFAGGFYMGWQGSILKGLILRPSAPMEFGRRGAALKERIEALGGDLVRGQIKEISGDTLTVETPQDKEVRVLLSSDTKVQIGRKPATKDDIKVGDKIIAIGKKGEDDTLKAKLVRVVKGWPKAAPRFPKGSIL